MITPADVYDEVKAARERGRQVLVGKMKLFSPGGRTVVSRQSRDDDDVETVFPQVVETTDKEGRRVSVTLLPKDHIFRNRYFARLLKKGAPWQFLGESDAWIDFFPIQFPAQELQDGMYILRGIVIGEVGEDHVFIAEDAILVEVSP